MVLDLQVLSRCSRDMTANHDRTILRQKLVCMAGVFNIYVRNLCRVIEDVPSRPLTVFSTPNKKVTTSKTVTMLKDEITDDGIDEIEALHTLTQETRANLIQDIIGHPSEMPSLKELAYMNPSVKNEATIRDHLGRLIEAGIVEQVQLPSEKRSRDSPYTFYCLTEEGRDLLEKHSIIVPDEEQIKQEYQAVEKPGDIKKYEEAERPIATA